MGIIRLLLAIAVFNSHFPILDMPLVDGHEAVLTFFAISGFYMALILDNTYDSARGFYMSRFLTLYPIYVFALVVSVALVITGDIHPMSARTELQMLLSNPASFLAMVWTSVFVFGQEMLFSLAQSPDGGLLFVEGSRNAIWRHAPLIQAWSLSLEILFYALAPFLVRLKNSTLVYLIALSLLAKIVVMNTAYADVVFFKRFFLTEFWLFGCGLVAYRIYTSLSRKAHASDYCFFAGLVVSIVVIGVVPKGIKPFALPIATLVALPFVFRGFRHFEFDRFVGKTSYPFYLLHFSAIAIFETYWDEPKGWHILLAGMVAALLTHVLFGKAIESLKTRKRGHLVVPVETLRLTDEPIISTYNV